MNIQDRILDYERRLLLMRQELNELLQQTSQTGMSKGLQDKLNFLQSEIKHMNYQLSVLQQAFSTQNQQSPEAQVVQPKVAMSDMQQNEAAPNPQQNMGVTNMQQNVATPNMQQNISAPGMQPSMAAAPKKKNLENTIGKSWMAVFASLLIFGSIIMFATLLIPNLSDTAKMGIMYAFSVGITVFGTVKTIKNSNNKLWISVAGCGVGSLYISLLLTYMYFHVISAFALLILILLWSVGICLLSKYQSLVFQMIGQIGICISILLGVDDTLDNTTVQMVTIFSFYIITQIVFFFSHRKQECSKNMVSHIGVVVNAGIIIFACNSMLVTSVLYGVIAFLTCYIIVCMFMTDCQQPKECTLGIVYIFVAGLLIYADSMINTGGYSIYSPKYFCVCYVSFFVILLLTQIRELSSTNKTLIEIISLVLLPIYACAISQSFMAFGMIALLCLIVVFICKDYIYQMTGMILTIVFLACAITQSDMVLYPCVLAIVLIAVGGLSLLLADNKAIRSLTVTSFYLWIIYLVNNVLNIDDYWNILAISFMIIAICNMILLKLPIFINQNTGESTGESLDGFKRFLMVVNGLLIAWSMPIILSSSDYLVLVILVSLALYSINVKQLLEHKSFAVNLYVGLKYTVLLFLILEAFEAVGIVISICCLILSIVSIVVGFLIVKKALRIYGLVLANLCVIKLVLIDIDYENLTQRALGFFICGILCFCISFIYNRLEQKNKEQENG